MISAKHRDDAGNERAGDEYLRDQILWCQVTAYLNAFFGYVSWGYAVVAFSWGVYLDGGGKVRWRYRKEMAFAWPAERDKLIAEVMARASYCDISICPNLMADKRRRKGNSVFRRSAHADIDAGFDARQEKHLTNLPGGCGVGSGTPGHAHVYTLMNTHGSDALDLANHQHLCRALGKWFGADDPKISDNDLMRLPGCWNFKPLAYDPNAQPLPVRWLVDPPTGGEYGRAIPTPTRVRQYMYIRKVSPGAGGASGGAHGSGAGSQAPTEPVNLTWLLGVKSALRKRTETGDPYKDTDRSVDTTRVVGACVDAGLTLPQTRWVVNQREDLRERIEARYDDDVGRCFAKITADRDEHRETS